MELYLSSGWYLINPREIRTVRYFQRYGDTEYSPNTSFDEILNDISSGVELSDEEKDKIRNNIEKIIEIEMYDRTDDRGHKYPNVLQVNADNDELFNYIYQNLSRKFGLRIRNKMLEEDKIIKLYEKGLIKQEIAKILNLKYPLVENVIEKYKTKTSERDNEKGGSGVMTQESLGENLN
jgi:hypothetical protein